MAALDRTFKELLKAFFPEFLQLFCPDIAEALDFSTLRFLDKEVFTDIPMGDLREADLVAEIKTCSGEVELVLVHTEIESSRVEASAFGIPTANVAVLCHAPSAL